MFILDVICFSQITLNIPHAIQDYCVPEYKVSIFSLGLHLMTEGEQLGICGYKSKSNVAYWSQSKQCISECKVRLKNVGVYVCRRFIYIRKDKQDIKKLHYRLRINVKPHCCFYNTITQNITQNVDILRKVLEENAIIKPISNNLLDIKRRDNGGSISGRHRGEAIRIIRPNKAPRPRVVLFAFVTGSKKSCFAIPLSSRSIHCAAVTVSP